MTKNRSQIIWLLSTALLLWFMIMMGGATRLTKSGLSIVEWRPITGIIPPLSEGDWLHQFRLYKQFPEYQKVNLGMTLEEFKSIFMMEYLHRLLGRLIGFWFFIPLVYFAVRRTFQPTILKRLVLISTLGIFQGFMGWYMVKSGLVDHPEVSPYRLTVHLSLAVVMLGMILWTAFSLMEKNATRDKASLAVPILKVTCSMIGLTIIYGALVSGLKAGLIYNTYPFMEGQFLPGEWLDYTPFWSNFLENPATVQWIHRWIAVLTVLAVGHTAMKIYRHTIDPNTQKSALLFLGVGVFQVALGIMTLLHQVPVSLGVLHQGNAIILFSLGLWLMWRLQESS